MYRQVPCSRLVRGYATPTVGAMVVKLLCGRQIRAVCPNRIVCPEPSGIATCGRGAGVLSDPAADRNVVTKVRVLLHRIELLP